MHIRRLAPADALLYRSLRLRALREHPDAFTSDYEEDRAHPPEVAAARAEGVQRLVLTVTEGNAHARRLYERAGFRSFGIEPDAIRVEGRSYAKNHMHLDLGRTP
jgi:hypothetical protein